MPVPSLQPMQRMVIEAYEKVVENNSNPFEPPVVVDIGCSEKWSNCQTNTCPTITNNRAATFGYWVSTKGARMSAKELIILLGFDADDVDWAGVGVTANQFAGCLGNAQSLSVVVAVLPHGLYKAKLITKKQFNLMKH